MVPGERAPGQSARAGNPAGPAFPATAVLLWNRDYLQVSKKKSRVCAGPWTPESGVSISREKPKVGTLGRRLLTPQRTGVH